MGVTSSTHSWMNSVRIPLCLGDLPLGREVMALAISFKVRTLVMSPFIVSMTQAGMLSQHLFCASKMLCACASEAYRLV